eukprot:TRINITY_DN1245_c0_g1_i1.p1 TRINITY_DN1245_c0_g1~~TRINITY_DN1245_c0_g1_i1.p1  ORF type:complete len:320 (+),score=82.83 TRINITY_DN1245_c0_g1_i1:474-1433(+)
MLSPTLARKMLLRIFVVILVLTQVHAVKLLAISKTTGFRHDSIPDAQAFLRALQPLYNFTVDFTEDSGTFTDDNLKQYAALVFVMTTGDIFTDDQKQALVNYIHNGGGFIGIHSASDTEHSWPWYGNLTGAYFVTHPAQQNGLVIKISNVTHISVDTLPNNFTRSDEWYYYDRKPELTPGIVPLLRIDESTIIGPAGFNFSAFHAVSWYHEFEGGRSWYTGMGHTAESYTSDAVFQTHLLGGVLWAAGLSNATSLGPPRLIHVPKRTNAMYWLIGGGSLLVVGLGVAAAVFVWKKRANRQMAYVDLRETEDTKNALKNP